MTWGHVLVAIPVAAFVITGTCVATLAWLRARRRALGIEDDPDDDWIDTD